MALSDIINRIKSAVATAGQSGMISQSGSSTPKQGQPYSLQPSVQGQASIRNAIDNMLYGQNRDRQYSSQGYNTVPPYEQREAVAEFVKNRKDKGEDGGKAGASGNFKDKKKANQAADALKNVAGAATGIIPNMLMNPESAFAEDEVVPEKTNTSGGGEVAEPGKPEKKKSAGLTGWSDLRGLNGKSDLRNGEDLQHGSDLRFGSDLTGLTGTGFSEALKSAMKAANRTTDIPHMTSGMTDEEYQKELDDFAEQWGYDSYDKYKADLGNGKREKEFAEKYKESLANRINDSLLNQFQGTYVNPETGEVTHSGGMLDGLSDLVRESEVPDNTQKESQNGETKSSMPENGESSIVQPSETRNRMTQMEEYYDWLTTTEEGQAFAAAHPEYATEDGYGYSMLRASQDRDAWAYALGLAGNEGIAGWKPRYQFSGVDMSDPETAVDNLMNYLYGPDAVDVLAWMSGDSSVSLGYDPDSMAGMARYLYDTYNYGPYGEWAKEYGLDANDIAYLALAAQVTNNGWGDWDPTSEEVNSILANAGDTGVFKFADTDSDEYESGKWREKQRQYSSNLYGDTSAYTPYLTSTGAYIPDADITGALMNAYNINNGNKKLILG